MAIIRAHCNDHGDFDVSHKDVTVYLCEDNYQYSYTVPCPEGGGHRLAEEATPRVVDQLLRCGCEVRPWRLTEHQPEGGSRLDGEYIDGACRVLEDDDLMWKDVERHFGGEDFKA